jgi:hypothetical protein
MRRIGRGVREQEVMISRMGHRRGRPVFPAGGSKGGSDNHPFDIGEIASVT